MKNAVFLLSFFAAVSVFVFRNATEMGLCGPRSFNCSTTSNILENSLYIFFAVLFFSIVTYRAPEGVFSAWWRFSSLVIPVILVLSFLVNLGYFHRPGGFMNMDDFVDQIILVAAHAFYMIGSIIQTIRGYRQK